MIWHKAICENINSKFLIAFFYFFEKINVIIIRKEDWLLVAYSVENMVVIIFIIFHDLSRLFAKALGISQS